MFPTSHHGQRSLRQQRAAVATATKGARLTMKNIVGLVGVAIGGCLLVASARADGEKVALDKLPKAVVDTVNAKWPKCMMKHATVEKVDGKDVYEIGLNIDKKHLHAVVTAAGKLLEIHHHIDPKDLPDKVAKAATAKYPKGKIDEAEEQHDANGKLLRYEVVIEIDASNVVILVVDPAGKIQKETKETVKKDSK